MAWTTYGHDNEGTEYGYIVGGHEDGNITLWNPTTMLKSTTKQANLGYLSSIQMDACINDLKFNFENTNFFAAAFSDVYLIGIDSENNELEIAIEGNELGRSKYINLTWNEKVPHVIAFADDHGVIYIYDMKENSLYLTIEDAADRLDTVNAFSSSVSWCADGIQLKISYDDPSFNFITQYHMNQIQTPSAEYHNGHTSSITNLVPNRYDSNFFLSIGRDKVISAWSSRTVFF